jgi:pyroglutamyl-peptidase
MERVGSMQPILFTGFEPFDGESVNASWEAVRALPDEIADHPLRRLLLPVEFGRSGDLAVEAMRQLRPACVIAVGEAAGRAEVTLERVALNVECARIPDNAGAEPQEQPVIAGGPDAYQTCLPLQACAEAARAAGVPTAISNTAGLYVCNQLMYRILHEVARAAAAIPAGFVHVPLTPAQAVAKLAMPSMESVTAARALKAIAAQACSTCEPFAEC